MRSRPVVFIAVATLAWSQGGSFVGAGSVNDDQARADAAMQAFNERASDLGFESTGRPGEEDDEGDFAACFEGFDTVLSTSEEPGEGETARASSDEFTLSPETTVVGTADSKPDEDAVGASGVDDLAADLEFVAGLVITYDEAHRNAAEEFVTHFGSDKTASCFRHEFSQAVTGEDGDDDIGADYELAVDVANESDLGIGEHSAQLDLTVELAVAGSDLSYSVRYVVAQVDRSLVIVFHGTSGEVDPVIDPEAELATTVASLEG